jgi:hypothetical protein
MMIRKYLILISFITFHTFAGTNSVAGQPEGLAGNHDFSETITIYTDRDFYIAGERLFFRLDLLTSNRGEPSSIAYLALRNPDNIIIESYSIPVEHNIGYGSIYLHDTLSSSSYQLVAFTNWMRNSGEDIFASKEIIIVNRFDESSDPAGINEYPAGHDQFGLSEITEIKTGQDYLLSEASLPSSSLQTGLKITTPKAIYGIRERIDLEIETSLPPGSYASLTISVAQKETLLHNQYGEQSFSGLDRNLPDINVINKYFYKETNGPVITGMVTDRETGRGIPGAIIILNTPDTIINLLYARTLYDGTFHFRLNDYHEGKELWFSIFDRDIAENANISINDKFNLEKSFDPKISSGSIPAQFIKKSQNIARINKALNDDMTRTITKETRKFIPRIYSFPAWSFSQFDDYEYLASIHEIARELIPLMRVRKRENLYVANLLLQYTDIYTHESPAFFLDGIYTDDITSIVHLDSDQLEKIELHNYRWRHGELVFPGIVGLFSKNNEYRNLELSKPSLTVINKPAIPRSLFTPPDHEEGESGRTLPDFRQTLYWEPELIVNNEVASTETSFYSGDLKGEFVVRVMGHTSCGEIIHEVSVISICDTLSVPKNESQHNTVKHQVKEQQKNANPIGDNLPVAYSESPDKYFEQGLSGRIDLPPHRPIGNQHYPVEEWITGDVLLETGITAERNLLRYNGHLDELFWLHEGDYQQVLVDKKMVREFLLYPPGSAEPKRFRRIEVNSPVLIGKDEIFGELLHEGDISVYSYRRIIEKGRGDYRVGNRLYGGIIIEPSHLYIFILPDGTAQVTRKIRRRRILDMFPEHRTEIRDLLRKNRIRPRNEKELIIAAEILNSFFLEKAGN